MYKPKNLKLNYGELLQKSVKLIINVNPDHVELVEVKTRGQAKSRNWFRMHAGRITASRFKTACHTDPLYPSLSLIMSICHPEARQFKTAAICWAVSMK